MASSFNDVLRDFSKKPLGVKIGTGVGVLAAIGLLYWQFFYSGLSEEVANLKATHGQLQQKHQQLKAREVEYKKLVKQNEDLKEQLLKNRVSLPTSAELPSFFVHLQKQAAASGVNVRKWGRAAEKPSGVYVKVPLSITISGTFYQILQYFHLLSQTDRIITVENLKIGGAQVRNDETVLTASFVASTFRLADGAADAALQTTPKDAKKEPPKTVKDANAKRAKDLAEKTGGDPGSGTTVKPDSPAGQGAGDKGMNRLTKPGAGGAP